MIFAACISVGLRQGYGAESLPWCFAQATGLQPPCWPTGQFACCGCSPVAPASGAVAVYLNRILNAASGLAGLEPQFRNARATWNLMRLYIATANFEHVLA
eukprot:CAMPEP_0115547218 /NCGR_PEP_ID=MMETSP0271-20121206/93532_1 /TAXON_ID=71861 /ORGANISM="Scrippsiella trochoidea, Strain CCMP3099" /LENGTH=100 /DNA_ID=CAMNT_0002980641 /DNA_START=133 /DNA_END=433 /DNA_ORIENTATION=+